MEKIITVKSCKSCPYVYYDWDMEVNKCRNMWGSNPGIAATVEYSVINEEIDSRCTLTTKPE